ncbi:MAG: alpha-L-fucosidase [Oscillospiraceae bacterium]|nr:alpha-L-fucosidase [Oscillospiraceae bacterium]
MQWYKRSMFRNLVDMHIPNGEGYLEEFDPEQYAKCMEIAGVETAYVYASNCLGLCLYPSKVGYRHTITEKRDIFGETVKALRKRGIGVVGYLNSWNTEAAKRHPDWQIVSSNGFIRGEHTRFGTCCPNSPFRDHFLAMVHEMVSTYDIDGFWVDMIGFFAPDCTCKWCREKYKAQTGQELPDTINWTDPNFINYVRFKFDSVSQYAQEVSDTAKKARPGISVSFQCAGWNRAMDYGLHDDYYRTMDYVSGDFYASRHKTEVICRILPNLSENMPFEYMVSRAPHLSYHTGLKSKNELLHQACTALLCGGSFLFIDAIDPNGKLQEALYHTMGDIKRELMPFYKAVDHDAKILRDVAVYINFDSYTQRTAEGQPSHRIGDYRDIALNLEQINLNFSRAHIDYDILTEKNIHRLSDYKVVVVPDLYRMSQSECEKLAEYVAQGGRLYISGASSALSTDGTNKDRFMLSKVMGVEYDAFVDTQPIYLAPTQSGEPWFPGFTAEYPQMLPFAVPTATQISDTAQVLATLTYPLTDARDFRRYSSAISNPPGRVTDIPAVVYHRYGKGACLYSCAPIEQNKMDCNIEVFNKWICNLLEENGGLTLQCEETEYLSHVLRHNPQKRCYTVSLLNSQNVKKIVPLYNLEFSLKLDVQPKEIYTTLGRNVSWKIKEQFLHLTIDKLDLFDVVYITY